MYSWAENDMDAFQSNITTSLCKSDTWIEKWVVVIIKLLMQLLERVYYCSILKINYTHEIISLRVTLSGLAACRSISISLCY